VPGVSSILATQPRRPVSLLFGLNEQAIMFVVLLGAAPSIANGVIAGIDHIPPQYLRLGKVLGARGPALYWSSSLNGPASAGSWSSPASSPRRRSCFPP
jgi:hypothetical protein